MNESINQSISFDVAKKSDQIIDYISRILSKVEKEGDQSWINQLISQNIFLLEILHA